ncbi:cyclohexadienyl dehydratase [Aneurinibacillus thermoaerophilus]|uniref:Cyclohexadienyl dehydratase n=2 Tax=Aneurinibacillus thermoaerophilus TaxID=143495 RepID=A0A1G7Z8V5_ANETH|nr:transporter substrate-binding domain-containing protein [Aneurinibacillus thermoaerophilus]MED0674855.1 transporter substrate-binding domain-containing protein [Aneurinibacillus thermoaerophilus]MED0679805.1 transporter substrate-binding domain-containing protein [Aneurinibacillus thermoaerophilus]MED0763939.1 transporter substrate-binding domain-containing protein [Aneurinibacillus thermoaerophilus]SDH05039.1 cyclohexadienyl dehydratase [Aneurinibacillus thermoaerophilus]
MKKLYSMIGKGLLAATLLVGGGFIALPQAQAYNEESVIIDGKKVNSQLVNGNVFVSAQDVAKALGRNVTIDEKDKTVSIESRLDTILKRGYIRVGTTGDYKPFTYFNPKTQQFEGYDIDAAKMLAKDLGVEVQFVKTSWPTLMDDLLADKFDIAVGGITRNVERQKKAHLSQGYIQFGKAPLIRKEDKEKFKSIEDINKPEVRIGVNPGGTNEKFVRAYLPKANVTVVENNLDIPHLVAEGKFDVMITDNIEAMLYAKQDPRLYAALSDKPFTIDEKGFMMHRGDTVFSNWIELWMEEMELKGEFEKLKKKWIE